MGHRFYLLGVNGRICAAEHFAACDDAEAVEVASALFRHATDVFHGYELWRGDALISKAMRDVSAPKPDIQSMPLKRQEIVLDLEVRLSESFECIRSSKSLIEAVNRATDDRQRRNAADNGGSLRPQSAAPSSEREPAHHAGGEADESGSGTAAYSR